MVAAKDWLNDAGKYAEVIPRDLAGNLQFRQSLFDQCRGNPKAQEAVWRACQQDILFWISAFVVQYNPNAIGAASLEVGPWINWDFQDEAVRKILFSVKHRRDLLIEKSREMGASWLCILIMVWFFIFHPRKAFLVISRDEDSVDNANDPNCLFAKIQFVIDHLPDWMVRQPRVKMKTKMAWINKLNGSTITGEASTRKAGVGGRAFMIFADEFSQIDEAFQVYARTSNTSNCRIFNGTHCGTGTMFHQLASEGLVAKLVMHWTDHPDKRIGLYRHNDEAQVVEYYSEAMQLWGTEPVVKYDPDFQPERTGKPFGGFAPGIRSPWYDEQVKRKPDDKSVAEDLDIDPQGSTFQYASPKIVRRLIKVYCAPPDWEGEIHYDPYTGKPKGLIKQPGGRLKLWTKLDHERRPPRSAYGLGGDICAGTAGPDSTASCISIIDYETGNYIGEFRDSRLEPHELAPLVVSLCRWFIDHDNLAAELAWENNGPGDNFGKNVLNLGFTNYFSGRTNERARKRNTLDPGWQSNDRSKRQLLDDYKAALFLGKAINRSQAAMEELLQFRYVKGTQGSVEHPGSRSKDDPSGAGVNHGDLVIACALAWMLCERAGLNDKQMVEIKKEYDSNSIIGRMQMWKAQQQARKSWTRPRLYA